MATAGIRPGETVLVIGATGGVGTAVLPLLAAAGARVIATAPDANAGLLRSLGADGIIGYAEAGYPAGADVVLNLVRPGDQLNAAARALRPGGRLITITFPVPEPEWLGRDDIDLQFVLDLAGPAQRHARGRRARRQRRAPGHHRPPLHPRRRPASLRGLRPPAHDRQARREHRPVSCPLHASYPA